MGNEERPHPRRCCRRSLRSQALGTERHLPETAGFDSCMTVARCGASSKETPAMPLIGNPYRVAKPGPPLANMTKSSSDI